jgi:recombination protein RecT
MPTMIEIKAAFEGMAAKVRNVAPKQMDVDRAVQLALVEIGKSADLQDCTIQSLQQAFMQATECGLEVARSRGEAWFVAFNNKYKEGGKEVWRKEATFISGYQGLIKLAMQSNKIAKVEARVVYQSEYDRGDFQISYGSKDEIIHKPTVIGSRGEMIGVYAIATFKDGTQIPDWLTKEDVEKVRAAAKSGNSPPWRDWPGEMWRKTAFRRLSKWLPKSTRLKIAIEYYDKAEFPQFAEHEAVMDGLLAGAGIKPPEEQPISDNTLRKRLAAAGLHVTEILEAQKTLLADGKFSKTTIPATWTRAELSLVIAYALAERYKAETEAETEKVASVAVREPGEEG